MLIIPFLLPNSLIIWNMCSFFGKNHQLWKNELAVLNNLMKSKMYRLEQLEAPLPGSPKTIDFKLRSLKTNASILVEVYNIHIDTDKVQTNPAS